MCASKEGGVVCPSFFCQDQEWYYSVDIEKVIIKEESVKEVKGYDIITKITQVKVYTLGGTSILKCCLILTNAVLTK